MNSYDVAVIGSGASAVQFVPEIQPMVKELSLFQRTAHWVLPKQDNLVSERLKWWFKTLPFTQSFFRAMIYLSFEILQGGARFPRIMERLHKLAVYNIRRSVKDPTLRKWLTPNYKIGCKRILQSNDWYPSLVEPNVNVVPHGVTKIDGNQVVASDGSRREVDVIIFGTGFEMGIQPVARVVTGISGKPLSEQWKD